MKRLLNTLLFLLPAFALQAQADTIFVIGAEFGSSSVVDDSTFQISIEHPADQLGQGYLPTQIQVGYRLFDIRGNLFRVSSVVSANFGQSTLQVVELQDFNQAPTGVGVVYRKPDNSDCVPRIPEGNTGLSPAIVAKIHNHNAVTGCGGSGGSTDAADINITDAGGYYTSGNVEGALQEVGDSINDLRTDLTAIAAGASDGVATAGTYDAVNDEIDIAVAAPGTSFSVDVSALVEDTALNDSLAVVRSEIPTNVSELANDAGYLTTEADGSVTNELQTVDTLSLSGTTLTLALENDNEAPYTVDLASLQDGTGTDDQTASEVPITDAGGYYTSSEVEGALQESAVNLFALDAIVATKLDTVTATALNDSTFVIRNYKGGSIVRADTITIAGTGGGGGGTTYTAGYGIDIAADVISADTAEVATVYSLINSLSSYRQKISTLIEVDANGNGDYTTIQAALTAANSLTGTVGIIVYPGVYTENLSVTRDSISLFSSSPQTAIIDPVSVDGIVINASNVIIDGFYLFGGDNNNQDIIRVTTTTGVVGIYNCLLDGKNGNGRTYIDNSSVNTIVANCVMRNHLGVGLRSGGIISIGGIWYSNYIQSNQSAYRSVSGGIYSANTIVGPAYVTGGVFYNEIYKNVVVEAGGVNDVQFMNCTFFYFSNGGATLSLFDDAEFYGCNIINEYFGASGSTSTVEVKAGNITAIFGDCSISMYDAKSTSGAIENYAIENTSGASATIELLNTDVMGVIASTNLNIIDGGRRTYNLPLSDNYDGVTYSNRFTTNIAHDDYGINIDGATYHVPTDTEPLGAEGVLYADDSEDRPKYHDGTSYRGLAYQDEIPAGGGTMSSFILAADTGTPATIENAETVTIAGGLNGVDATISANTVTVDLDLAEVAVDLTPTSSTFLAGIESGNPGNWLYRLDSLLTYFQSNTGLGDLIDDISNVFHTGPPTSGRIVMFDGIDGGVENAPINNTGTYIEFTQATGTKIATGTTAEAPAAGNFGLLRGNETTGRLTFDDGVAHRGVVTDNLLLYETYSLNTSSTLSSGPLRQYVTFAASAAAAADYTLTIPTPSASLAGHEITIYTINTSPTYFLFVTAGTSNIRRQTTTYTDYTLTNGTSYTLKCMRTGSASYMWVMTSEL